MNEPVTKYNNFTQERKKTMNKQNMLVVAKQQIRSATYYYYLVLYETTESEDTYVPGSLKFCKTSRFTRKLDVLDDQTINDNKNTFLELLKNIQQQDQIEGEFAMNFLEFYQKFVIDFPAVSLAWLMSGIFLYNNSHEENTTLRTELYSGHYFVFCSDIYMRAMKNPVRYISRLITRIVQIDHPDYKTIKIVQKYRTTTNNQAMFTILNHDVVDSIMIRLHLSPDYKVSTTSKVVANRNLVMLMKDRFSDDKDICVYPFDRTIMSHAADQVEIGSTIYDIWSVYKQDILRLCTSTTKYHDPKVTYYHKIRSWYGVKPSTREVDNVKIQIPVIKHNRTEDEILSDIRKDIDLLTDIMAKAIEDHNSKENMEEPYKFTFDDLKMTRLFYVSDGMIEASFVAKKGVKLL